MNWKRCSGSTMILALLVCAVACQPKIDQGRRECPHTFPDDSTHDQIRVEVAGLDVPEFNDCQRFIVGGPENLHYGDYFAIFAKRIANSIEDSLNQHRDTLAFSVAIVLGYGDYDDLGIRQGANCLILWRESGEWRAKMAPRDATPNRACDDQGINLRLFSGGTPLSVKRQKVAGFLNSQDYSGAARWSWDDSLNVQIAGIPCSGARSGAWCDVGPEEGFSLPGTYHQNYQTGIPVGAGWQRVTDIKGWHDEQLLALAGGDPGALPRVSQIVGTVIPDSQLGSRTFDDWEEAAQVALLGPEDSIQSQIQYYTQRFGFTATSADRPLDLNKIFACRGEKCVSNNTIRGYCRCPEDDLFCRPDEHWYAKVVSADRQETVYHRMCYYSVCDDFIPATARWRWLAGDEGTWFRCVHGCCELLGEE